MVVLRDVKWLLLWRLWLSLCCHMISIVCCSAVCGGGGGCADLPGTAGDMRVTVQAKVAG